MEVSSDTIDNITQKIVDSDLSDVQPGVIEKWVSTLPEKAFYLGIRVAITIAIFLIGMICIRLFRKAVKKTFEKLNVDKGSISFVDSGLNIILISTLVIIIAINYGLDATSVAAFLMSLFMAIGLGLQGALANVAGGLLILVLKPFKVGDYIYEDTHGNEGTVTDINIFYTHLLTVDNKMIFVPNGVLANSSLTNLTWADTRMLDIKVGISYASDLTLAKETAYNVAADSKYTLGGRPVRIYINELGESAVELGIRIWVDKGKYWDARWSLLEEIKLSFDKNGIEIPYNQLDIHMKS